MPEQRRRRVRWRRLPQPRKRPLPLRFALRQPLQDALGLKDLGAVLRVGLFDRILQSLPMFGNYMSSGGKLFTGGLAIRHRITFPHPPFGQGDLFVAEAGELVGRQWLARERHRLVFAIDFGLRQLLLLRFESLQN